MYARVPPEEYMYINDAYMREKKIECAFRYYMF